MSSSTERHRPVGGLTLLELVAVLAIVALATSLVVPRLRDPRTLDLETAAHQLADGLSYGRTRAILGGRSWRVLLDLDARRWQITPPVETPDDPATARPTRLPETVRFDGLRIGGAASDARGTITVSLDPAGDAWPVRIELASDAGRRVAVVLPPAAARAVVVGAGST